MTDSTSITTSPWFGGALGAVIGGLSTLIATGLNVRSTMKGDIDKLVDARLKLALEQQAQTINSLQARLDKLTAHCDACPMNPLSNIRSLPSPLLPPSQPGPTNPRS